MQPNRVQLFTISGVLVALTVVTGWFSDRADFGSLLGVYGIFFALYLYVLFYRHWTPRQVYGLIGLGILLRIVLLFSLPNWSDDFYRFLWDGRLAAQGVHPFAHPPSYFMENQVAIPGITPELYAKLNSPEYHTVYPPVCQAVFWLAAKLFPEHIRGGVFVMKLFLLVCELGTIWMLLTFSLRRWEWLTARETPAPPPAPPPKGRGACLHFTHPSQFGMPKVDREQAPLPPGGGAGGGAALAYALNPLILLEIVGNCHFEGAMLCFLLAGIFALLRGHLAAGAAFWALATASKLIPLLFLPVVLGWLGWRRGGRFLLFFTGICLLLFLPLLDVQVLRNMAGSLNLYFRQFEFNASGYYLLKWLGTGIAQPKMDVARTLGPILAGVVALGTMMLALYKRPGVNKPESGYWLPDRLLFSLMLYLALATTVHPWYVAPLFGLSLLTPYRFPLIWTAAAILSYSHYAGGGFREHYGWIALEYLAVYGSIAYYSFASPTK